VSQHLIMLVVNASHTHSGFMHAHVSYLSDESPACLLLLTVERDIFFDLSEAKKKIVDIMEKNNSHGAISTAVTASKVAKATICGAGPELRHFFYKARTAGQYAGPSISSCPHYAGTMPHRRLMEAYSRLQARLHSHIRSLKIIYRAGERETVVGWVNEAAFEADNHFPLQITQAFELYAAFAPGTPKADVLDAVNNKMLKWAKREENTIFILNAPTF